MKPGTKFVDVKSVPLGKLRVDARTYAFCMERHKEGPVYPCPVCFLLMAYQQPLMDYAHGLIKAVVANSKELGPVAVESEKMLKDFQSINEKLLAHVVQEGRVQ